MQKRSLVGNTPNIRNVKAIETTVKHCGHVEENGTGDDRLAVRWGGSLFIFASHQPFPTARHVSESH